MAQNIYDDEAFFAGYAALPRSRGGLESAPEWPLMRSMVGNVANENVVDLGCGFGWFCRWAAEQGANSVLGLDLSHKMLARARSETRNSVVRYKQAEP